MAPKPVPFPGFTPITDRVYLRNDERTKPVPADEPTTIVILGWGDGMPKHVSKYSDGFHTLFPSSRIIVVLSGTKQASNQPLEARVEAMMPVIDLVFPTPTGDGTEEERVIFHTMSNTGGIFLAAVAVAYQQRHGDKHLPHSLLVCDSTPGGLNFASQVGRWSRAMAVSTAKFFPWPFIITHALWYSYLWANWAWERLRGVEPSGVWATRVLNDPNVTSINSTRLYLYSKEDEIIWYEDLEANAAEVKELGYSVEMELFEGSLHVGHGRMHPDQYWNRISNCWKAIQSE